MISEYKIFPEVDVCPKCGERMSVSDVIPTMHTTGFDEDELVYRCHRCGAKARRAMERRRTRPRGSSRMRRSSIPTATA